MPEHRLVPLMQRFAEMLVTERVNDFDPAGLVI